jgi:hypothetical protein
MNALIQRAKDYLFGKTTVEKIPSYDKEQINKELAVELQETLKVDLIMQAKTVPLSTLDGKPNPQWVKIFKLGFPNLLEEEIKAKQLELIQAEVAIIDAFLDKEDVEVDDSWIDDLNPEVKMDDLGYWHVKINGQWCAIASSTASGHSIRDTLFNR